MVIPYDRLQSILSQHPLAFDLLEALASYRRANAVGSEDKSSSDLDVGASDMLLALKLSGALDSVAQSAGELLTLRKLVIIEVLTEDEARLGHSMLSNLDRAYSKSIFDDIPVERADAQRPLFLHEYSRWADLRVQADLADAVRRNSLVLCLAAPGTESMPASMRNGADVITRFPDTGPQHLNLIFQAVLGQTSEALKTLERTDRLTLSDIGAIVRPAQQIEDCVRKLRQCLQTNELPVALPKLDSAHGYGSANAMQFSAHKFTYALGPDCDPLDLTGKRKQSAPSSVAATFVASSDVDLLCACQSFASPMDQGAPLAGRLFIFLVPSSSLIGQLSFDSEHYANFCKFLGFPRHSGRFPRIAIEPILRKTPPKFG